MQNISPVLNSCCCCSDAEPCRTLRLQHARLSCPSLSPSLLTLFRWVSDDIQPSHLLLLISSALNLSQHQVVFQSQLFALGGQSIGASASASVLPKNIQNWFPLRLTELTSLLSKGLKPQFKNINSSVISLLYGPPLTSIHDYRKNHSFDYINRAFQLWEYYQNSLCLQIAPFVTLACYSALNTVKMKETSFKMQYLDAISKATQNDLCSFPRQTIQYHGNPSLCPDSVMLKKLKLNSSMKT